MNTTGCPEGYASDQMFQGTAPESCETPLAAYYSYTLFIVVTKFLTAGKIMSNWIHRKREAKNPKTAKKLGSVPYVAINATFFVIINFIIAILGGLNLINFHNGLTLMLFSVAFLPFAWAYTNGLLKLVHLGERIIPRSHQHLAENYLQLATFDNLGKSLLVFQVASLVTSSAVLIILGPIMPQHEQIFLQVGFAFKAFFAMFSVAGYVYQFERCIRVINEITTSVAQMNPSSESLAPVVRKMRLTQALHILAGSLSVVPMTLLAANAIPANVFIVLLPGICEGVANMVYAFALRRRLKKGMKEVSPPGPDAISPVKSIGLTQSSKGQQQQQQGEGALVPAAIIKDDGLDDEPNKHISITLNSKEDKPQ